MDDLISEFIEETTESISVLDSELVKLEQNPNDEAILGNIFRLVHTIKGTCGFLGLPRLESVAHAGENVLGKIRDKELEVTPQAVSLILEALDVIRDLIEYLSENGSEPEGEDGEELQRLFDETPGPELGAEEATPAPATSVASAGAQDSEELQRIFDETPGPELEAAAPPPPPPAAPAAAAEKVQEAAKKEAVKQGLEAKGAADSASIANQSIRVNLEVLENLMQMVGELVLTRNQLLQIVRNSHDNEFMAPIHQLSHITTELQEQVMKTRMQPIGNAWAKFPRLIRDLSMELGKKIELRMMGAETELDRQLLELIKDPLTHMVRNSCDHGLEPTADRISTGKPEIGTVTLSAYHEGGHIIIDIIDDGRGINVARVKEKAVANGLASASEVEMMSDSQAAQFIFKAGFSTAEQVTAVSGRGVGMDVVRTNIEKIGGTIDLSTEVGRGSTFSIKIPLTLAIVSVLIVEARGEKFAVPQINVVELVMAGKGTDYPIEELHDARVMRLRDRLLPLINLHDILQLPAPAEDDAQRPKANTYVAVIQVGGFEYGLVVDRVFDTEEIVVKLASSLIKDIAVYSGNTILGDGSVIMILDPNGMAREVHQGEGAPDNVQQLAAAEQAADSKVVTFLLFSSGDESTPKAVPLELVARLEEIDAETIEFSGDVPVVQYRDELMRLKTLDEDYQIKESGIQEVIVFRYDNQMLGLAVEEILDIVEAPYAIKMAPKAAGFLGSTVINGKVTDIVDVGKQLEMGLGIADAGSATAPASADIMAGSAAQHQLLFVEDSPFFRNLTIPHLQSAGFQVTAVGSAIEALELMNGQACPEFDVMVVDIEMPGMNGFEFTKECKTMPRFQHIPMFAFTSTVSKDFIAKGKEVGFQGFINKTERQKLLDAIAAAVHHGASEFVASSAVR